MRGWGVFIATGGVIYLFIAFNMGVSVTVPTTYVPGYGSVGGDEVANLDLMARRQNHLIVAAVITLVGALMAILGNSRKTHTEGAVSKPQLPAKQSFTGERDLTNDGYRLWLARTYSIERNQVFDCFILDEQTFETLDKALLYAHNLETEKARAIEEGLPAPLTAAENAEEVAAKREKEENNILILNFLAGIVIFGLLFIVGYSAFN
jgi:hypothetical protein